MEKKIFISFAVLAVAAVAAWNVYLASAQSNELSDLMLANVEALARGEDWNWPWDWDQGFTKDEYAYVATCLDYQGVNGYGIHVFEEKSYTVCSDGGNINCTPGKNPCRPFVL
jgi:hypothetical protein